MQKSVFILLFWVCFTGAANHTLRDPTAPSMDAVYPADRADDLQGYVLNSIIVSPTRKIAVINQKIVREGDSVEGKKIIKISREGVLLQGPLGEKPLLLKMKPFTKEIKK